MATLRTPIGLVSLAVIMGLAVLSVIGPTVWGDSAATIHIGDLLQGASGRHWLGTDNLGRDLLARVLVATRLSLSLAVLAITVAAGIGIPLGALPTVLAARPARIVAGIIEIAVAFPALLLAIFFGVVIGVGATSAVLAIGIASAPGFARMTQTLAASAAGADYVAAARVIGVGRARIVFRHVLPNIAEPIILNLTIAVGSALLALSGLSFIGLGVQAPQYDWGRLLNDALNRIYVTPQAALGPACAIVIAGLAFNGLGEALAAAAGTRLRVPRRHLRARAGSAGTQHSPTPRSAAVEDALLVVENLNVTIPHSSDELNPVRDVSFAIARGELLGMVGESGSGKSLTALAIANLAPYPSRVQVERLDLLGHDLARLSPRARKRVLGTSLAMVFQDPANSLNPAVRIGRQLAEVSQVHNGTPRRQALGLAVDRLRSVRVTSPERRVRQFPHELSGGMRQRTMIAMGLMGSPQLIIADEPTSALDVTVQKQILRLLREVGTARAAGALIISHDLAVVAELCHRVVVMYAGRIVEDLDVATLRAGPAHPYTRALLAAIPDMAVDKSLPLATIGGHPPDPSQVFAGCAFAPRCAFATERCRRHRPALVAHGPGRRVACWHPQSAATPTGSLTSTRPAP